MANPSPASAAEGQDIHVSTTGGAPVSRTGTVQDDEPARKRQRLESGVGGSSEAEIPLMNQTAAILDDCLAMRTAEPGHGDASLFNEASALCKPSKGQNRGAAYVQDPEPRTGASETKLQSRTDVESAPHQTDDLQDDGDQVALAFLSLAELPVQTMVEVIKSTLGARVKVRSQKSVQQCHSIGATTFRFHGNISDLAGCLPRYLFDVVGPIVCSLLNAMQCAWCRNCQLLLWGIWLSLFNR